VFLRVDHLSAGYGKKTVIFDVSLHVDKGEIVTLIGPNGAGKSTTMKAIFGLLKFKNGEIFFDGKDILKRHPSQNVKDGISFVAQGPQIFPDLSVHENISMGGYTFAKQRVDKQLKQVYEFFPILGERKGQAAGSLSGGERQMLALATSLMLTPRLLLLDEPSVGLAPFLVKTIMENVKRINTEMACSVLIIEQNARQVLTIAHRVYVMKVGRVVAEPLPEVLLRGDELKKVFLV
jgi:ABC-type branched-subunit amino acid transport system ATPase component